MRILMLNYERSEQSRKIYKFQKRENISNLMIVSMIPGDRKVAGCFDFFGSVGGIF